MTEQVKVRKGNVVLRVPKEQQGEYVAKGFDVVDADGNAVVKSVPSDVNTLKKAYSDHLKEIEALKAEIAELKRKPVTKKTTTARKSTRKKATDKE